MLGPKPVSAPRALGFGPGPGTGRRNGLGWRGFGFEGAGGAVGFVVGLGSSTGAAGASLSILEIMSLFIEY